MKPNVIFIEFGLCSASKICLLTYFDMLLLSSYGVSLIILLSPYIKQNI